MNAIFDLPDYPAILKLASALHRADASRHGAAIMIGAGFSRSAACHVDGRKKIPLWDEFTQKLAQELYASDASEQKLHFANPLRIAEEYRAYFGEAVLNDKIRTEIENDAFQPGPLHRLLLELPWSEVLTTNWDTLLEEAATDVHSPYYTSVTKISDLAWAQSPRIVKLHGTIGITDSFVVTQEDYRTYPQHFAPFVNLARQVFIENELCLLGFSGDDPNFLRWTGWVRDQLANHARKVYLVGALNLSPARRKQLESMNVAPVDLWPMVAHLEDSDLRHKKAIELFLEVMRDEERNRTKVYEWRPSQLSLDGTRPNDFLERARDPSYGAECIVNQLEILQRDRESYPGWLICPPSLQWRIVNQQMNTLGLNQAKLAAIISPDNRTKLLYEVAWRHSITFEYIDPWLSEALFELTKTDHLSVLSKRQQLEIALALLNNTRWCRAVDKNEQMTIDERTSALIEAIERDAVYLSDCSAEIAYYRALKARDQLDFFGLASIVESIVGEDPVWKLRKAALLMELGRSTEASQLLALAYGELRKNYHLDRQSIPILSRLLWAHWLFRAAKEADRNHKTEELPAFAENNARKWKCEPRTWIDSLRDDIDKEREEYLKQKNLIEPLFEQGHYRKRSLSISITNVKTNASATPNLLQLDGLSRTCGIPLLSYSKLFAVNLLASDVEKFVLSGGSRVELWDCTLAIRSAYSEDSDGIKRLFSRIGVACISRDVVDTLVTRVWSAVMYWQKERTQNAEDRRNHALSQLRVFLEVLSRLAVRLPASRAKELFSLAASFGGRPELQHRWLFEVLGHLLAHSLSSVPESEQGEMLPIALAFPLASEVYGDDDPYWPNPVVNFPNNRGTYPTISERIKQLITSVRLSEGDAKRTPLLRLLPLAVKSNFLTDMERRDLAAAIWGDDPKYQTAPTTGLYLHALLMLPAPDPGKAETLIQAQLYRSVTDVLQNTQKELRSYPSPEIQRAVWLFNSMANAATNKMTHMLPTAEQAQALFCELITWRPSLTSAEPFFTGSKKALVESICEALSYAIVPALADDAKTNTCLRQLEAFYSEVEGTELVLPAFVYFSNVSGQSVKTVNKIIRTSLRSRDSKRVQYAAIALARWMEFPESDKSIEFERLVSEAIEAIESHRTTGLHSIIKLAKGLVNKDRLSKEQYKMLAEVAPDIYEGHDYINVEPDSADAITASAIRAECARLAQALQRRFKNNQKLQKLLSSSKEDPLPEVRFAVNQN